MTLAVDLHCRVVDNFGDAGVCWRLARQLAREHGARVVLRIDRPDTLRSIEPRAAAGAEVDGVRIRAWPDDGVPAAIDDAPGAAAHGEGAAVSSTPASPHRDEEPPVDVVVSAFGCDLPPRVRARLAADAPPPMPLWVNLEYLSAEDWVDGCHGLASVKPADGAVEHFFYPGFTAATGGLLRERGLTAARDAFVEAGEPRRWLAARGFSPQDGERLCSLFCYADAPVAEWLALLAAEARPVRVLVPAGVADAALAATFGHLPPVGTTVRLGRLALQRFAWLDQDDYDRLLWSCDLNLVRGEDSWIRAHWAARPFVWQPYPQDDGAHVAKLDAFLRRFDAAAGPIDAAAALMRSWSGAAALAPAWRAFARALDAPGGALADRYRRWSGELARRTDLCTELLGFIRNRL